MASNTRWAEDKDGKQHPEDSVLFAYLRQQHLEDHLKINRHLDVEQCPRCRHRYNDLAQVSTTLDVLAQMPPHQHYPELSVARTYEYVQRTAHKSHPLRAYLEWAGNRQRPRMSAIRLVSLPLALVLALFCVMLVFAHLSGVSFLPGSSRGATRPSQSGPTAVERQHITPTPNLALTATARAGVSPTPTASPMSGPYITVCSTSTDVAHSRLVICGFNFEPGHKVSLVVTLPGKVPNTLSAIPVDKQGRFQDRWYVFNCKNLPTTIFAYEVGNKKISSNVLVNISFAGCSGPTPTPVPSGV
jgi:hypothetical protein